MSNEDIRARLVAVMDEDASSGDFNDFYTNAETDIAELLATNEQLVLRAAQAEEEAQRLKMCEGFAKTATEERDVLLAKLDALEKWGEQYGGWTPEEHDAFLAIVEGE